MVNAKTPNKKRKSVGNVDGSGQSPKTAKLTTPVKTPGKNKGNATPGKPNRTPPNKTPKAGPPQNNAKTPKQTPKQTPFKNQAISGGSPGQTPFKKQAVPGENPGKTPKQTPFKKQANAGGDAAKTPKQQPNSGKKNAKNKRSSESENEGSPAKLKKFAGTEAIEQSDDKKKQKKQKPKIEKTEESKKEKKTKRRNQFGQIKEKLRDGDQSALVVLEKKIKALEDRKTLTKSAKRKLKILQKLRRVATGETTEAQKNVGTKQQAKVKKETKGTKKNKQTKIKSKPTEIKLEASEEDDENSESDYEVEAEINPDKIIKTTEQSEDESGDEEVASGEEEEESGEEEEESGQGEESDDAEADSDEEESDGETEKPQVKKGKQSKPQLETPPPKELESSQTSKKTRYVVFVGNLPYDVTKDEISEHFKKAGQVRDIRIPLDKTTNKVRGFAYVEFDDEVAYQKSLSMHHTFINGRRINVAYTEGQKGGAKSNNFKVKNLKLAAMRKQGKLHGSVKQDNKRSARRAKNKVLNGSN